MRVRKHLLNAHIRERSAPDRKGLHLSLKLEGNVGKKLLYMFFILIFWFSPTFFGLNLKKRPRFCPVHRDFLGDTPGRSGLGNGFAGRPARSTNGVSVVWYIKDREVIDFGRYRRRCEDDFVVFTSAVMEFSCENSGGGGGCGGSAAANDRSLRTEQRRRCRRFRH